MSVNGWFPDLNGRGEVVSGAGDIYFGDRLVGPGHHPKWVDDDWIVYDAGAQLGSIILNVRNGEVRDVHPNANVYAAGAGLFLALWQGAPVTLRRYSGTELLEARENCGPMAMAPNGRYVFADNFGAETHTLHIHELGTPVPVPLYTGPTMNLSIADRVVCWQVATGPRKTNVYGLRLGGSAIENWTVFEWEDPVVCDGPDGPWILSVTQGGLILRPAGATVGYQWNGDYRNPAIRCIGGVFQIASSDGFGVAQRFSVDPATPRRPLLPPVIVTPPPPPPQEPTGPRAPARQADGRVYDLLTYILGEPGTWPRKGPTHPMNQVLGAGGRFHYVKFGDVLPSGEAYETWGADADWIRHFEDASGEVYAFADTRWYPRRMPIGQAAAFDTGEHENTYRERATCQVIRRVPFRRRMWVEAIYDRFYWGPDLGERETLVAVYDPTAGIHTADRILEVNYFAKGAGWVRWEAYRSDLVYPKNARGAAVFAGVPFAARSDFYLLGGPNTQPKLSGCVPPVIVPPPPDHPNPPPPPDPQEDTMKTVAIKGPGGKYGRADASGTGPWGHIGWRGIKWDGDEPTADYQFELTQPDDRFKFVHIATRGLLGVDATKFSGSVGEQFYLKPDENDRGAYESPVVYEGNLTGFLEGVVEYADGKYPSCAFAVEVLP
jgi:hypothetical protein